MRSMENAEEFAIFITILSLIDQLVIKIFYKYCKILNSTLKYKKQMGGTFFTNMSNLKSFFILKCKYFEYSNKYFNLFKCFYKNKRLKKNAMNDCNV
jgi:hypothetical protein